MLAWRGRGGAGGEAGITVGKGGRLGGLLPPRTALKVAEADGALRRRAAVVGGGRAQRSGPRSVRAVVTVRRLSGAAALLPHAQRRLIHLVRLEDEDWEAQRDGQGHGTASPCRQRLCVGEGLHGLVCSRGGSAQRGDWRRALVCTRHRATALTSKGVSAAVASLRQLVQHIDCATRASKVSGALQTVLLPPRPTHSRSTAGGCSRR